MKHEQGQQVIVQNCIIMVTGLPWSGKSFFATFLASFYREIFSNLDITRMGILVSNRMKDLKDAKKIWFSNVKWCILIEEAWVNINSRKWQSEENMEFSALGMLWRKKNKDIIVIAQLARTVDINIRELCKYRFDMRSFRVGSWIMFEVTIYDRWGNIMWSKEIDLVRWANMTGFSYNTLEESIITNKKEKNKKEKIENEYAFKEWLDIEEIISWI